MSEDTNRNPATGFDMTRRNMLKQSAAAAVAAGMGTASTASFAAPPPFSGVPFKAAPNEGFPYPSSPVELWALDYAGSVYPGMRNGPALYALFYPPTGLFIEENGDLKVCDARNSLIRNISHLGDVTVFSGSVQMYPFKDGDKVTATFNSPNDIDRLSDGSYVVGDRENNAIRLMRADGNVSTIAGQGNCKNRYNGDHTVATAARLNHSLTLRVTRTNTPWHVADTVYFADRDNHLIRKLVPNGDGTFALVTVAGTPPQEPNAASPLLYYPGHVDGPVENARFRGACGITLSDDERYLYVAERDNNVVRVIDLQEGMVGTYAGVVMVGQKKGGYADGPADLAMFNGPSQIAFDADGNLYMTDRFNHRVRKILPSSDPMQAAWVETVAGNGEATRGSGPALEAGLYEPWGIAVDRNTGLVYVADTGNSRVMVIGPYQDIWQQFEERVNVARTFEMRELMEGYGDFYRGSRKRPKAGPLSGEG